MERNEFDTQWRGILAQADKLRAACTRLGLTDISQNVSSSPVVRIGPPASEAEVVAVERTLERPIPGSLRQLFREGSADIEVSWMIPSVPDPNLPDGFGRYLILPPPPLQRWSEIGYGGLRQLQPVISACSLRLSLGALPMILEDWRVWLRNLDDDQASDETGRRHLARCREFWSKGFPIASSGGGDILAIDTSDPAERLIILNHEGDWPGYFTGRPILDYLHHQSLLGFIGFGNTFPFWEYSSRDVLAAFPAGFGHDNPDCGIDADSPNGRLWREWLGI